MPVAAPKMKVTIAPATDPRFQGVFDALSDAIEIEVPDGFLVGQIASSLPSSNVGPILLNGKDWYVWDTGTNTYVAQTSGDFIGSITFFAFSAIDTAKYLICDGRTIPRIAPYDKLYAKLGTSHGAGDGSTTFQIPDCRGRALIGTGTGSIPATDTVPATALTARALGDKAGEETHALIAAELPVLDATGTKPAGAGSAIGYSATAGGPHNNMQPVIAEVACIRYA